MLLIDGKKIVIKILSADNTDFFIAFTHKPYSPEIAENADMKYRTSEPKYLVK